MKLLLSLCVSLFFIGCAGHQKGDYVTYTSTKYLFIQDTFINKSMDCLELGEVKQGGLNAKFCVGFNYASQPVQGFVFEHKFSSLKERYLGSTLSFKTKSFYTISCKTESIDYSTSGTEYINRMVPQKQFDMYGFIVTSPSDLQGTFRTTLGSKKVYSGVIDRKGKELLMKFYKNLRKKDNPQWKRSNL